MVFQSMRIIRSSMLLAGAALFVSPSSQSSNMGPNQLVWRLACRYIDAQSNFDVETISKLTAPDYVEVSPIGEVDSREMVLGFYAPDKRSPSPKARCDEPMVRIYGDTAVVVVRSSFDIEQPGATSRTVSLRVTFVARFDDGGWRLVSGQYTGIRTSR